MKKLRFLINLYLLAALPIGAQVLSVQKLPTSGHPFAAMISPDGNYVFCGVRNGRGEKAALDVFHRQDGGFAKSATLSLPSDNVEGIVLIPGTGVIAMGLAEAGIGFVPLEEAERGTGKIDVVPVAGGVAGLLAVSNDGKLLFAGDEYGEGGMVRAFALQQNASGPIAATFLGKALTPRANAGLVMSRDGRRVFTTGEIVRSDLTATLDGHGNSALERQHCMQDPNGRPAANGALYTIDAKTQGIVGKINAGCSPTRVTVSSDGKTVYLTARGDNQILAFNAAALEKDPSHAFLRAIPTGGTSPVGLALFDGDRKLLVANSNRFANGPGNAAVLDLSDPGGKVIQTIPTGDFPRNVEASKDGKMLALAVFGSSELVILQMK